MFYNKTFVREKSLKLSYEKISAIRPIWDGICHQLGEEEINENSKKLVTLLYMNAFQTMITVSMNYLLYLMNLASTLRN